ncbi:hypothetical protein OG520_44685 (plasmid) [Streptomyces sp. NBC_00984]|uniref:hypothetical protein n=1 Tax=Streptomyces sp. NBC_00984 TaxID=2903700 RepID=UPI002F9177D9|nr:hypothetical protein OG520_44685 [Streptomyces sp. NBC_00984]
MSNWPHALAPILIAVAAATVLPPTTATAAVALRASYLKPYADLPHRVGKHPAQAGLRLHLATSTPLHSQGERT